MGTIMDLFEKRSIAVSQRAVSRPAVVLSVLMAALAMSCGEPDDGADGGADGSADARPRTDARIGADVSPGRDVSSGEDVSEPLDVSEPSDVTVTDADSELDAGTDAETMADARTDSAVVPDGSASLCGNGTCDPSEHCGTCSQDCRACTGTAPTITRGPYLQNGSTTAVTVRWRTSAATNSVVAYGTSPTALTSVVRMTGTRTEHTVRLTGLRPDTKYYYAFGTNDAPLRGGDMDHYVRTAPTGARATRLWVIGDAGTATANQRAVRDAYYMFNGTRETNLWLMLGDNAYDDGTDTEYQAGVFNIYQNVLRNSVVWSTLGNHDGHSADSAAQTGPYYNIFNFPTMGEAGGVPSGTEAYYSFDYGAIHFVSLDSYDSNRSPTGPMLTWLQNDLQATNKEWIIAIWHHPPYSKGSHDSDTESAMVQMRTNALPILERHGVDLVLTGHSHSYERSMYLNGHYGVSSTLTAAMTLDRGDGRVGSGGAYTRSATNNRGAVYAVAGSSGKLTSAALNHRAMFVSLLRLGSMVIDVDGRQLDARFIDNMGRTADSFTIRHE